MLDLRIRERCRPIGLWGYGEMGSQYLDILIRQCGFSTADVCVVERDAKRLQACRLRHPEVFATADGDRVLRKAPPVVLVCVNTPERLPVLRQTLPTGAAHFVEKPLVMARQLGDLAALIPERRLFAMGYLENFSGAVQALLEIMPTDQLFAREICGLSSKNRCDDSPSTLGVLEDQAMPLLRAALTILEWNQRIGHLTVDAALSRVVTIATAHVALGVATDMFEEVLISTESSFTAFTEERRLDVMLAGPSGCPTHLARLEFDVEGGDRLFVKQSGKRGAPLSQTFPARTKNLFELEAFLTASAGGVEPDPRLVTVHQGILMVQLSALAIESDHLGVRMRAV